MTTCPIQLQDELDQRATGETREGGTPTIALYQEQALSTSINQPYRQRVLLLSEQADLVELSNVRLRNQDRWSGLCRQPLPERVIATEDLGDLACVLRLAPQADGYFGSTPKSGCPSNYQGASYVTNTVWLTETTMETLDQGFDSAGNQVWGADGTTYEFVDLSQNINTRSSMD